MVSKSSDAKYYFTVDNRESSGVDEVFQTFDGNWWFRCAACGLTWREGRYPSKEKHGMCD